MDNIEYISLLRKAVASGKIEWHKHTLERMMERSISRAEVKSAALSGEIIETYPKDFPYPSCLILHSGTQPLHIVAALDPESNICHIITSYRPDAEHFESDYKTRRVSS